MKDNKSATFKYNNGDEDTVIDAILDGGEYFIDAPKTNPKKDYMTFDYWAADEAGTTAFDWTAGITADTVVYAKFYDVVTVAEFKAKADSDTTYYILENVEITSTYGSSWATYGNFNVKDSTGEVLIYGLVNEVESKAR